MPEWRWRECSDAGTAVRLARSHGHVALVTESSAAEALKTGALVRLALRPAPKWSVPLTLAYRSADADDPAIAALRGAAGSRRRPVA